MPRNKAVHVHVVPLLWIVLASIVAPPASSRAVPAQSAPGVRAGSPRARVLLEQTLLHSATVRRLAAELAATDVIVYVEFTANPRVQRAATTWAAGAGPVRFLRIALNASLPLWDQGPLVAHELWHALEIARDPSVRGGDGIRALYQRIGQSRLESDRFETAAAVEIERTVRTELFGGLRARAVD